MQEHNLGITIGPVNHGGEGFRVALRKGHSEPQYMSNCKFCGKNISFHIHQNILTGEADSFLCPKCGKMHNKAETIDLAKRGRWATPTCKFYIDNYKPYINPSMISVRVVRWQEFKGGKLTGDTVVELPKCTGCSASYEGIRTAESFDKWVTIQVSPNKKPTESDADRADSEKDFQWRPGILPEIEFKTMGIDPMKDSVEYCIVGWTKDKEKVSLEESTIVGSIESESTKKLLAKIINVKDVDLAVIDESYHTTSVRDFAAQNVKVNTYKGNCKDGNDSLDDRYFLASIAADRFSKKPTEVEKVNQAWKKAAEKAIEGLKAIGFSMANAAPITPLDETDKFKLTFDEVVKCIANHNSSILIKHDESTSKNVKTNALDEVDHHNKLDEIVSDIFSKRLKIKITTNKNPSAAQELCHAAKTLENALTTLSIAKDTEDDYLITCAELAVEESRNELAKWIELFEKGVEQHN